MFLESHKAKLEQHFLCAIRIDDLNNALLTALKPFRKVKNLVIKWGKEKPERPNFTEPFYLVRIVWCLLRNEAQRKKKIQR